MKQKLFRTVMAFFLMGAALTWVGCSDEYDEDIQKLNDRIDELTTGKLASIESQQASLQATLDGLRNADNALGQRIDELKSQQSTSAADLKKLEEAQAALKSTIEAVEGKVENAATQDWVNATLQTYATAQEVGEALAAIEALGKFSSEKSIQDALDAAEKAAVEAAGKALESTFQNKFDAAFAAAVANDEALANKIDAALVEYDQKVADAIAEAVNNGGEVSSQIAMQLATATEGIKKYISARLTSVLLIPDLYEDGIETIELKSLAYYKWTVSNTEVLTQSTNGNPFTTSQAATQVRYHVSPSVVQKEDVEMPSLVFEKAETRAAVGQLLNVTGYDIAGGVLTVDVKKTAKTSLNVADPYIYTAALKVPIAQKHLTEGESDVAVYSDYVKVIETVVYPKIAALTDLNVAAKTAAGKQGKYDCIATAHHHFSANYADAQAAEPSQVAAYNKQLDLTAMVTGCYLDKNGVAHEITKAALKAAGLEFRFAAPTLPYKIGVNLTDQQQFITVGQENGKWVATSKLPDGTTNNQAAIDKTPIVRVELIDTQNNNAIVDVRYFKVKWLETLVPAIDLGVVKTFDYTLSCNDFIGEFTWEDMTREILAKLNGNLDAELDEKGMSYEEFKATYMITAAGISTTDGHRLGAGYFVDDTDPLTFIKANANVELAHNFDTQDQSTTALVWRLHEDQIGTVIDKLLDKQEVTKNITLTILPNNRYHGALSFTFVVNIHLPVLPEIFGFNSTFWEVDYTLANVYPVQYNTPNATATCEYNYDLDRLFVDSKVLKKMTWCGKWDIQFSTIGQPNGYSVPVVTEPAVSLGHGLTSGNTNGYYLRKGTIPAAQLNYSTNMGFNWYGIEGTPTAADIKNVTAKFNSTVANINLKVAETVDASNRPIGTTAGIGLLGQDAQLKVWASLNCYNWFEVHKFNVHFVKPLKINEFEGKYFFEDFVMSGSKIDWTKAFTMTDFKDYIVAKVTTGYTEKEMYADQLYDYYAIRSVVWDTNNAKTNLKLDAHGNLIPDENVTASNATIKVEQRFGAGALKDDGRNLVFKNIRGVPVEKEVKLFVPVTVEHKWGTESKILTITVYPEGKTPAAPAE